MHVFIDISQTFRKGLYLYIDAAEAATVIAEETGANEKSVFSFLRNYSNTAIKDIPLMGNKHTFVTDAVVRVACGKYARKKGFTPRLTAFLNLVREIEAGQHTIDELRQKIMDFK